MPTINTSPIDSSPEEYAKYIEQSAHPSVICFVPRNNFDNMDYAKKTAQLPQFVSENSVRIEAIVKSMVAN